MQKKISILIMAMFLCFGTTTVFAQSTLFFGKSQIRINAEEGSKNVILDIDKVGSEKIKLSIKDANEELLKNITFDEVGAVKKRFILSDLPAQQLTFNFEGSINKYTQVIDLQVNKLKIDCQNLGISYKPTLTKRGNRVFVQWIFRKSADIELTVIDSKNDVFFEEKTKTEDTYTRSFNITQLIDGEYFITLRNDKVMHTLQFIKSGMNIENRVATR